MMIATLLINKDRDKNYREDMSNSNKPSNSNKDRNTLRKI